MTTSNKQILGRIFFIHDKEYVVLKDNEHTYVKLGNKVVYDSNKSILSVSQWLKEIKK